MRSIVVGLALVVAAGLAAAALSVSDASLDNATQRIRALLAAQKDEESANAL